MIAVSAAMRDDVLRVLPRRSTRPASRSSTTASTPTTGRRATTPTGCASYGVDPDRPVGGVRRPDHPAEGAAAVPARGRRSCRPRCRSCSAPAPRTPPRSRPRSSGSSTASRRDRDGVVWIREMLPRPDVVALLTAATAFVCPSIYEPLGIVNLEAMACETAVVATATGGIPEVVVDGETGPAGPDRAGDRRHRHAAQPRAVRRRLRRGAQRGRRRPGAGRRDGQGRAAARDRGVQLGGDRRADRGGLPLGALSGGAPAACGEPFARIRGPEKAGRHEREPLPTHRPHPGRARAGLAPPHGAARLRRPQPVADVHRARRPRAAAAHPDRGHRPAADRRRGGGRSPGSSGRLARRGCGPGERTLSSSAPVPAAAVPDRTTWPGRAACTPRAGPPGVETDVVHLATDDTLVPLPMDEALAEPA